jgi:hypothetical protein
MSTQLKNSLKIPGSLVRPKFAPGIMLLDEDLTAAVEYPRALTRLLFRSLFGCGVVCGFEVAAAPDCGDLKITVKPGVALDGHGDPIEVCSDQIVGWPCEEKVREKGVWLVICRSGERSCVQRDVACPGDDGGKSSVPTRTTDCFEIKLLDGPDSHACGCTPAEHSPGAVSPAPRDAPAGVAAQPGPATPPVVPAADQTKIATGGVPNLNEILNRAEYWNCHREHYCGVCNCGCCGDDCVVLAKLVYKSPADGQPAAWTPDYSARRFIRPMLAPDPKAPYSGGMNHLCDPPRG